MFLVRVGSSATPLAEPRELRTGGTWRSRRFSGGALCIWNGPGLAPQVAVAPDGDWLLAFGTPYRPGRPGALSDWLADVQRSSLRGQEYSGIFVLLFFHAATQTLEILTDPTGIAPVYLFTTASDLYVSSSALAIAREQQLSVSRDGVACMFIAGHPLADLSLFEGVRRVGPGRHVIYAMQRLEEKRWWTPPPPDPPKRTGAREYARELHARCRAALEQSLAERSRLTCSLTGGLDSRCVAALVHATRPDARYFTGQCAGTDATIPPLLAKAIGLNWSELAAPWADAATAHDLIAQIAYASDGQLEPVCGTGRWSAALCAPEAVTAWGLGGEIYRDYWSSHEQAALLLRGRTPLERLLRYRCKGATVPLHALRPEWRDDLHARAYAVLESCNAAQGNLPLADRLDRLYIQERVRRWASEHYSVIGRWTTPEMPLCQPAAIDLGYRLPLDVRRGGEVLRWVLHETLPAQARLPINEGYSIMPRDLMSWSDRARDFRLHLAQLRRKLIHTGRGHAPAPPTSGLKYREVFADILERDALALHAFFREDELSAHMRALADQPFTTASSGYLFGLELVLRAAATVSSPASS